MEQQTTLSILLPGTSFYLYRREGEGKGGEEQERVRRYEGVVEGRERDGVTIKASRDGKESTMKLPPNTVVYLDIDVGGSKWTPNSSKQRRQYLGYYER